MKELFIPYEPKKTNRWLVKFPEEFEIPEYTLKSITKPKYISGKWDDVRITFNAIANKQLEIGLKKMIYTQGKTNINWTFKFTIEDLDPTGVVIGKWEILVDEVVSIDFGGELTYHDDKIQEIVLIVKPYDCEPII